MKTKTLFRNTLVTLTIDEIKNIRFLVKKFQIDFVVELGTYKGGSALVFKDAGASKIYTFDHTSYVENPDPDIKYNIGDIFTSEETEVDVKYLCSLSPRKILFCDNGDKKKEINTFANFLNLGDVLCAHDFGIEFNLKDVKQTIKNFKLIDLPFDTSLIAWVKN